MTRRIVGVGIVLLVSALIACRRDEPRQADPSGAALSAAAAPQDTAFAGTTASVHRARPMRPGVPPALLRAVETASGPGYDRDRKSTRLNSSHGYISYAVFCLKKKKARTTGPCAAARHVAATRAACP